MFDLLAISVFHLALQIYAYFSFLKPLSWLKYVNEYNICISHYNYCIQIQRIH